MYFHFCVQFVKILLLFWFVGKVIVLWYHHLLVVLLTSKYCDLFNFLLTEEAKFHLVIIMKHGQLLQLMLLWYLLQMKQPVLLKYQVHHKRYKIVLLSLNFCLFYILCTSKEVKGNVKINPLSSVLNNLFKNFFCSADDRLQSLTYS